MRLTRISLSNVRSFLEKQSLELDGSISIVIGPNGGGKTNLLDTTTLMIRRHLLQSWAWRRSPTPDQPNREEFAYNDTVNGVVIEKHSRGSLLDQLVEIELEVTEQDIKNMSAMKRDASVMREAFAYKIIGGAEVGFAENWNLDELQAQQKLVYRIINNSIQDGGTEAHRIFKKYLNSYETEGRFREKLNLEPLSTPMLSLPTNRASAGFQSSIALADYSEFDFKRTVDAANSRATGSIMGLAIGRIATKYRVLLEKDQGKTREEFPNLPEIKALTSALRRLGYDWELVAVDLNRNQYDIRLSKQGSSFLASAASSGEKEILTYLFAIYGLNVRDALVIVDEPELHLHPRWQQTLLSLFEDLAQETGNQFLLATHSPVFVSPQSIRYVSRVFSLNQESAIIRLDDGALPDRKHLLSIINSQNNEKIFFADTVILVEGTSDALFFRSVFQELGYAASGKIREFIAVGGKNYFATYEKILQSAKVPYAIISDLDYMEELGSADIQKLFQADAKTIKKDVIDNIKSLDGASLHARLRDAIETNNTDDLKNIWDYINSRHAKLQKDILPTERKKLNKEIEALRNRNVFVLSEGDLETYLPEGFRSKNLGKLVTFLDQKNFWESLPEFSRTELKLVLERISAL